MQLTAAQSAPQAADAVARPQPPDAAGAQAPQPTAASTPVTPEPQSAAADAQAPQPSVQERDASGSQRAALSDAAAQLQAMRERLERLEARLAREPAGDAERHEQRADLAGSDEPADEEPARSPFALHLHGYGDLQFALHDYGPNQNREGGSQRDSRLELDTTRFVLALEGELPFELEFEAEVELEHGGTGTSLELDYEEFGEFEQEVSKGGEVALEELYLKKNFAGHYSIAVGRFYVATGLLSAYHEPTDYLGTRRSEAETAIIPAVWDEMGLQLQASFPFLRATAQVVNGLDSSGFSSHRFIASGQQRRFELVRASDLAVVGRVDLLAHEQLVAGVSAYYGGTTRNRPKPDLVSTCSDAAQDEVAPCGYVKAPLLLLDAHAHLQLGRLRASALVMWGHLDNAAAISSRNERLSNALGVARTPVGSQALAVFAELGADVLPPNALHRLEPFVRFDFYDTMFAVEAGQFDNPRFKRTVFALGVAYTFAKSVVLKLDASHRRFGSSSLHPENSLRLAAGFVY